MNLYLFNDNDSAAVYGIGTYLKELTQALEDSGINLHIVHLRSVYPKFEIVKTNQVENWYIPEVRYENPSFDAIQEIEYYYRNVVYLFRRHIKDTKDLIFQFNFTNCYSLSKGLKAVFDCKTVAVVHYTKWHLELRGNLLMLRMIKTKPENQRDSYEQMIYLSYEYESSLFKEVDRVIALSQYMQNILISDYEIDPYKISVIPNGLGDNLSVTQLSLTDRLPIPEDQTLRHKYHIPDIPILLFAGRLDYIKGLTYALRAFKIVLNTQRCHFIIAGSGSFDVHMKECNDIWMHVTWTGLIDKETLYDFYSIADIGVMPSFHEQCSYVCIEMMMHGLPIIGSTTTGLKEMILDGETGLHIPVIEYDDKTEIDSSLLAEKILFLLQNKDERKRMGANARKRYETLYSADIFRQYMLNFYSSLYTV